jgi:hypothetical protein
MPPWPIDPTVGIQHFKNDRSLTETEIQTIVEWVDQGAPLGDPADLPPPVEWPSYEDSWKFAEVFGRPPDLVISSPPYTVVANGMDQWPRPQTVVTGIEGERWMKAVEVRPGTPETRYVFHHANPRIINREETGYLGVELPGASMRSPELVQSAVGTEGYIFPEGTGRLIAEGDIVDYSMHMFPAEHDVDAVLEVGVWLYPEGEVPEHPTVGEMQFGWDKLDGMENNALIIPPHSKVTYRGSFELAENARVHSLRGHMHMRGAYQIVEVIYPNGEYELVNKLDWDHGWHTAFLYEEDAMPLWPKGTRVILTSVHDNTEANRYNPDPDQWVVGGARTVDEMHNVRFGITFYPDEEEFQALVREREAKAQPVL